MAKAKRENFEIMARLVSVKPNKIWNFQMVIPFI
jgi:hypothetical protein